METIGNYFGWLDSHSQYHHGQVFPVGVAGHHHIRLYPEFHTLTNVVCLDGIELALLTGQGYEALQRVGVRN
ncbi:MAG: hypothetical protein JW732_07675 [Dehalococcoidia bacterium]|nr:hypothetical protein [Dehalococcoidia bacterium]